MNFLTGYSAAVFERLILKLEVLAHAAKRSSVHQVRVDMKRIHALLYLVNHVQADKKLTEPALLRKIFDAAGELREVQVEKKFLGKWKMGGKSRRKVLKTKWSELERNNKLKLHRAVNQPGQKTLEIFHDKLDKRLSQMDSNKTIEFITQKYVELQSTYKQEGRKRKKLHKLRRILKNLLYVLEALDHPQKKPSWNKKGMDDLRKVLDMLGNWHDLEVAVVRLVDFQKNADPEFLTVYNELIEKSKRIRRKYFKKAQKAADQLLSQDLILT